MLELRSIPSGYARYPFLSDARELIEGEETGFEDMLEMDVRKRARDRVVSALGVGEIGEEHRSDRVELYSYPLARVLVSVVDEHALTRRYCWAEANTAYSRFREDIVEGGGGGVIDLEGLIEDFGIDLMGDPGDHWVSVEDYLRYASGLSDDKWKLVNRSVEEGSVSIARGEVLMLIREGVRQRVGDGLPLDVPDEIKDNVMDEVEDIREELSETQFGVDIEVVEEEEFPPCMKTLLMEIREGEHLAHHSRFAITSFLTNIGMSTDEIVEMYEVNPGFGEEMTRYQTDHIRGETSSIEYSCPSCSTMVTYGDCRNKDDLCEEISHPLGYYRRRIMEMQSDEEKEDE